MKCDEARTLLAVHRDLSRSQEHQLQLHLAGCPRCAAVKQELGLTTRLWSGMPEPGHAAVQRVVARAPLLLPRASRRPALRRGALTLSALALVAALGLFFRLPGWETPGASGATTPEPTATVATREATRVPTPGAIEAGAPVKITFHGTMIEKETYQALAEAFMAQNPDISIEVIGLDEGVRMLTSADGDEYSAYLSEAVDVTDSGWLHESDAYDLKPFIWGNPAFQPGNFHQPAREFVSRPDKIDKLPFAIEIPLLSYNRQLWAGRGLPPPEGPLSKAQLLEAAAQLASAQDGANPIYGILDETAQLIPWYTFEAAGISFTSTPAEELRLNTPEGVQALERSAELLRQGAVLRFEEPSFPNYTIQTLLDQGRIGIWPFTLDTDEMVAGRSYETGTLVPADPRPWVLTYAISAASNHPQAAWRWISYLSGQDLHQSGSRPGMRTIPARRSVPLASTHWSKLDAERERAVELVLQGQPLNPVTVKTEMVPYAKGLDNYLDYIKPLIEVALENVLEGGRSPQEALDQAQARLDQRWPKGGEPAPTPSP